MTGLLTSLLLAAAFSVAAAALAWLAGLALQSRARQSQTGLWRTARFVAVLPLLLAPILYAVPQTAPASPALEYIGEAAARQSAQTDGAARLASARAVPVLPSLEMVLAGIYLFGLLVAGSCALRRHYHRRHLLGRSRVADRHERALLDREAEKLGLSGPELRISLDASSPFLTGWRGVIVAPEALFRAPQTARHALVHELCHLRRGDERDRLLGAALSLVLWFNWPLRRIERELDAAREIACDSDAIRALGLTQCRAYAAALIETMRSSAQPVSAFGPHNRRHREMRIKAILSGGQTVRHSLLTAATLLVLAIPMAGAQVAVTPHRAVSAPVDQIVPRPGRASLDAGLRAEPRAAVAPQPAATAASAPSVMAAPVAVATGADGLAAAPAAPPQPAAAPSTSTPRGAAPELSHRIVEGRVSSAYGPRPARPAGAPRFHGGTDIATSTGTAIAAPGAGTVIHAAMGYKGSQSWGNTVEIDHGNGWSTLYAHLDAIDVEPGQAVAPGQSIGTVGATGVATGPHVHVELHHDGERVDPADYLTGLH